MADTIARVLFDSSGNAIKVTLDGSDYKYEFLGKLRNAAGDIFNPATQETLLAADTKLGTIDGVLDSIKDTDGIKKITDALPAGTNEIGKVAQGTKAAAADGWPTVLHDTDGNVVSVYDAPIGSVLVVGSVNIERLLIDIKKELMILNLHMALITDDEIFESDVEAREL